VRQVGGQVHRAGYADSGLDLRACRTAGGSCGPSRFSLACAAWGMPCPIFEYDLRKLDWCPEQLDELAEQVNHVFRTHVVLSDLEVIGTNHLDRRRIWTDDDLETWLRSENPAYSREGLEEDKILRVTLPQRVLPLEFKQGEVPVIIRGNKTAEFEGDGRADARLVEFKLKFFDCGHFYMTQSRANASTPMYSSYSSQSSSSQSSRNSKNLTWTVFEGTWRRSARGYRLEFLFKYPRTNTRSFDFIMQALPERNECSLNFSGEEEVNLKGFLPTVASHESSCWASMRRKAELPVNRRSNKMFDDQEEKEKKEEEEEEEEEEDLPHKQELVQSLLRELTPEQQQELRHALGKHGMTAELYQELSPPLRAALQRLQRRADIAKRRREMGAEGEPTWPMYLGLALFVFVFAVFAYIWVEEYYWGEPKPDEDEDEWWRRNEF